MAYTINVNGRSYSVNVPGDTPLLWVLRDVLGLTGTKYGCGIEVCHACNVWIDGSAEKCCKLAVKEVTQVKITTIEGLSARWSEPPDTESLDRRAGASVRLLSERNDHACRGHGAGGH
jgi:isoquinoline 1-oxidoreductase alpha subunit